MDLAEQKIGPYDTRPPLQDRAAAALRMPESFVVLDARPASSLLVRASSTELRFVENRFTEARAGTLNYVSWDDAALRTTIPSWQNSVGEYAAILEGIAAESPPGHIARLPEIGARMRGPKDISISGTENRSTRASETVKSASSTATQPMLFNSEVQSDSN